MWAIGGVLLGFIGILCKDTNMMIYSLGYFIMAGAYLIKEKD